MIKEAEAMAEQDKAALAKIEARNGLEGYAFQVKNTVSDSEKVEGKISPEDIEKVKGAVKEVLDWLEEDGTDATAEELTEKREGLEALVNPIVGKLYQGNPGGGPPGGDEDFDAEDL